MLSFGEQEEHSTIPNRIPLCENDVCMQKIHECYNHYDVNIMAHRCELCLKAHNIKISSRKPLTGCPIK
jgi:nitrate/nitrite-specific signal transduction histidine kinase